jgi:hypothetical protein
MRLNGFKHAFKTSSGQRMQCGLGIIRIASNSLHKDDAHVAYTACHSAQPARALSSI